jgi:hypothetical protein
MIIARLRRRGHPPILMATLLGFVLVLLLTGMFLLVA